MSGAAAGGAEIFQALAESASAGIGISAAVMAIAKELEPLKKTTSSSSASSGVLLPVTVLLVPMLNAWILF